MLAAATSRRLTGRPEFDLAILVVGEAVLRFEWRVGDEGIGVGGFHDFGGGLQRFASVAIAANGKGGRLFAKSRFDQEYCSRTCVNRAQVNRFRRNQQALKQLYPGKKMKQFTTAERARLEQLAKSFALKRNTT